MVKMSSLLALFLVCTSVSIIHCQPFTVSVATADYYEFGADVTCKVTITNSQSNDYYLLKRDTPLEPINNNIFSVTQGDNDINYDGLLYQRIMPTRDEYALVPAKSSIIVTVDLSHSYTFDAKDGYTVQLDTKLTYYQTADSNTSNQHIVSNREHFTMEGREANYRPTEAEELRKNISSIKTLDLDFSAFVKSGGAYVTPSMSGTPYGNDVQTTLIVYNAVYNVLATSYYAVDSNTKNLYSTWFGTRYSGYMSTVKGAYLNIKSAMEKYRYTMYFDGPECAKIKNVIAYTYKGSNVIYLCSLYRSEPATRGSNTKLGTVLHEFTHAVARTDDITYGQSNCAALARSQPDRAIQNADNYRCFTEPLV